MHFDGENATLKKKYELSKKTLDGYKYIEVLRSQPDKPIHALSLYCWDQVCPHMYVDDNPKVFYIAEIDAYCEYPDFGIEMTDEKTVWDIGNEIRAINAKLTKAVEHHDYSRADDLRDEKERCEKYLMETSTPWGDIKNFPSESDNARRKIKQAINYYLIKLEKTDPAEAKYIRSCLTIGIMCMWSDHKQN